MNQDRYSQEFVIGLFDEMSKTYGVVNLLASFGFTYIWRKYCVGRVAQPDHRVIVDLMTGMGENYSAIVGKSPQATEIVSVDFSTEMCRNAKVTKEKWPQLQIQVLQEDALASSLKDNSADALYCSFGLKTLTPEQQTQLAKEVHRILKPGGVFSFIEISVPPNFLLKLFLLFYLRIFIPVIGKMCLGNPANYRMLSRYTESFGCSDHFVKSCKDVGLQTQKLTHFFNCATGAYGSKI